MANIPGSGIPGKVTMPTVVNGTDSRPFSVASGAKVMSVYVPDLVGAATTLKLQALAPQVDDVDAETWLDVATFNLITGANPPIVLDEIPELACTTIPVSATGAGPLRFVASVAQTGAADAISIRLRFGQDG